MAPMNEHLLFVITVPLSHSTSSTISELEATLFWLRVQRKTIHDGWIVTRREKSLLIVVGMQRNGPNGAPQCWIPGYIKVPDLGILGETNVRSEGKQREESLFHFSFSEV